ncbi:MAG TPA: PfkB family carbohydrate kinase [Ktedonobacterales bacterium]|nr:PfkB family carbohydrate kinase [Ktedonobacterales bacterium]
MGDDHDDQEAQSEQAPDLLVIGHVTYDILPGGTTRLGGTPLYAGLTAARLGWRVAIVTSGPNEILLALQAAIPGVAIAASLAPVATTFEHLYPDGVRRLRLRERANLLGVNDIPLDWRSAPVVLLAPVIREIDPELGAAFPNALVAATAQGWLRRWESSGMVIPKLLEQDLVALPTLQVLLLSYEDLLLPSNVYVSPLDRIPITVADANVQLGVWSSVTPLVVATRGSVGASLRRNGGPPEMFPAYKTQLVDSTGAGDVFAAAFLYRLRETGDPRAAMDFANRCASISVEGQGTSTIPTLDEVIARYGPLQ